MTETEQSKKRCEYVSPRSKTYVIAVKALLAESNGGATEQLDEENFDWSNNVKEDKFDNLFDEEW